MPILAIILPLLQAIGPMIAGEVLVLPQREHEQALRQVVMMVPGWRKSKSGRTALQVQAAKLVGEVRPTVQDSLPPIWSCRTQWECDLSVALIVKEIDR